MPRALDHLTCSGLSRKFVIGCREQRARLSGMQKLCRILEGFVFMFPYGLRSRSPGLERHHRWIVVVVVSGVCRVSC